MKSQRVGIFYMSNRDGKDRSPVSVGPNVLGGPCVFVRCEIAGENEDLVSALANAKPRPGEAVMNTHYVSVKNKLGR